MFYHHHDDNFTKITKHLTLWISLLTTLVLFIFLFRDDIKIPQKEIILKIDVKNKVNICLPENDEIFEKSFFDF